MTDIDVPVLGERIVYTWADDVAARLNRETLLELVADEATNSATVSTITGLEFPVENGKTYRWSMAFWYECDTTSQGAGVGFRHPGGVGFSTCRVFGVTGGATEGIERILTSVANTDTMTTGATVSTADALFSIEWQGFYECTADGTFSFRKKLNGTPSGFGFRLFAGSGGVVYLPA